MPRKISKQKKELAAIKRVLKLVDGYASTQPQHVLIGWNGGVMTWSEIRDHIKAAIKTNVLKGVR